MLKIGTRIYFEKNTGNIITWEGDKAGWIVDTTFEQDYENYTELQKYNKSAIGTIQLKYGEFDKLMIENKANRFKVDVTGQEPQLVFFYAEIDEEGKEIETEAPRTIYDDVQDLKKSTEEIQVNSAVAMAEMIEKYEKERLDNSLAMAEVIEKIEKDKTELSLAMAETIEMMNKKEGN